MHAGRNHEGPQRSKIFHAERAVCPFEHGRHGLFRIRGEQNFEIGFAMHVLCQWRSYVGPDGVNARRHEVVVAGLQSERQRANALRPSAAPSHQSAANRTDRRGIVRRAMVDDEIEQAVARQFCRSRRSWSDGHHIRQLRLHRRRGRGRSDGYRLTHARVRQSGIAEQDAQGLVY